MGWPPRETGDCRSPSPAGATVAPPTEDLFVCVYALIDDAIKAGPVAIPPRPGQRRNLPPVLQKIIAEWRNRIEAIFGEITDQVEPARHGARACWGLLACTAAVIAAHTLLRACLADLVTG